jgi:hypothetical protein
MKFLSIFIIYLFISQSISNLVDKKSYVKFKNSILDQKVTTRNEDNKWFRLFKGIIVGMTNTEKYIPLILPCLPKEWSTEELNDPVTQKKDFSNAKKIESGLRMLQRIFGFVSKFKKNIQKIILPLIKRNRKKVFLQKTLLKLKNQNFFDDVAKSLPNLSKMTKKKWSQVSKFGETVANGIVSFWTFIRERLSVFLGIKLSTQIDELLKCLESAKSVTGKIYKSVQVIYDKINIIVASGWVGFAAILIELISEYKLFREIFNILIEALRNGDVEEKYFLLGQFIGRLLKSIGNSNLRKIKLLLI